MNRSDAAKRAALRLILAALAVLALVVAFRLGARSASTRDARDAAAAARTAAEHAGHGAAETAPDLWTCAMHPQIKLPKPGNCPICGMELIPARTSAAPATRGGDMPNLRRLELTPEAVALASIETAPVRRGFATKDVRMVGKVDYDETRVKTISAWVGGRIDRLYVDYTGVEAAKGDHLVYLYSPELLTAQEELIQAVQAVRELRGSGLSVLRESAAKTVEAARDKLRLLGLTSAQIQAVERRGETTDHVTIYAPIGGTVIAKEAVEGMYVETGMAIYTIADLSRVWVRLDAYESDMAWVRFGQDVAFETEAWPGETFHGTIAFIDPVLNPKTRTVNVRVNVPNPDGRLKPEMFVRAVVRAGVASGGRVMDPRLSGKWISPMHPEIVRDRPGKCPVCGMDLVRAEDLGYVAATPAMAPLTIPASAPLVTGERAVVYVRVPSTDAPTFEGREVVLGPRASDAYVVRAGLEEGEEVVVRGNFHIDSALQIQARPSMMSPEGGGGTAGHQHGGDGPKKRAAKSEPAAVPEAFLRGLGPVYGAYLEIQTALSADRLDGATSGYAALAGALSAVDMGLAQGHAHMLWMEISQALALDAAAGREATNLAQARAAFDRLSEDTIRLAREIGTPPDVELARVRCPMAFQGRGARWLQEGRAVRNPYFGAEMLGCGDVEAAVGAKSNPTHAH